MPYSSTTARTRSCSGWRNGRQRRDAPGEETAMTATEAVVKAEMEDATLTAKTGTEALVRGMAWRRGRERALALSTGMVFFLGRGCCVLYKSNVKIVK
jgi:hypothetical protein